MSSRWQTQFAELLIDFSLHTLRNDLWALQSLKKKRETADIVLYGVAPVFLLLASLLGHSGVLHENLWCTFKEHMLYRK